MAVVSSSGGGLGYRYVRDPRADSFLMGPRLAAIDTDLPTEREWALGPTLDQGQQGSCVGHGWTHWRNAAPVQPDNFLTHHDAVVCYDWAQLHDEWSDTPPEEGTSVQAGAKYQVSIGVLGEGYVWGRSLADLVRWLGLIGPVVMGTLWLSRMDPDNDGFVRADGLIDGGHCYLCYGYKRINVGGTEYLVLLFQNSWGTSFGDNGCFYMLDTEFEKLLARGHYSMCSAMELAPAPVHPEPLPEPEIERTKVLIPHLASRPSMYVGKHLDIYERRGGRQHLRWKADPA